MKTLPKKKTPAKKIRYAKSIPVKYKADVLVVGGGPAGVAVVIVREDMVARARAKKLPTMVSYGTHVDKGSMHNTPPCFAIYLSLLALRELKEKGGLPYIEKLNKRKANALYSMIDRSGGFYRPFARKDSRSRMNVTFRLPTAELEEKCAAEDARLDLQRDADEGGQGPDRVPRGVHEGQQLIVHAEA